MVELMFALVILAVGILGTFQVFESSNRATSVSETQQDEIHRAQRELEKLESLPYRQLFLTTSPATSAEKHNPGFYVKTGSCPSLVPSYQWNQTSAVAEYDQLVINGCTYKFEEGGVEKTETLNAEEYKTNGKGECIEGPAATAACGTGVTAETPWKDERTNGISGTVYDYITWVKDENCSPPPGKGCPKLNDYKRLTVEVTNNTSNAAIAPTSPVLVSAVLVNPKALPTTKPKSANPLESTEVKCTNGLGEQVKCNYGLGNQTAHTWYLTSSPVETGYESTPKSGCMHYTDALKPSTCGGATESAKCVLGTVYTSCPQLDLLNTTEPEAPQEAYLSENLESTPFGKATPGRIITRDPKAKGATPCTETASENVPSENAAMGEWWATAPLTTELKLSGNGGLTLNTRTFKEAAANVTLCVGVYLENPVEDNTCKAVAGPKGKPILDPLNLLNSTLCASTKERKDTEKLGAVSFTKEQWPGELTPLSFTFSYMSGTKTAAVGTSLAVRIWLTEKSGDDIVAQYDAKPAASLVQLNTE
jgi:type II secretory pathway component PulJ